MPGLFATLMGLDRKLATNVKQQVNASFARADVARNRLEETVNEMLRKNDLVTGRQRNASIPKPRND